MSTEQLEEPDLLKAGWLKIFSCVGLLILAVFSPYALTYVLFSFVLAEDLKIVAFLCGIVVLCLSVALTFWTIIRWGLSLNRMQARNWLSKRARTPLFWLKSLVVFSSVAITFFALWILPV